MGIISNLLFGDGQNKVSYKDALKDKYYNEGITANYDKIYGGLNDYLENNYQGGARKYKSDIMQQNTLRQNESTANYKANRNNVFGNGLIGGLLNPIAQTISGVGDLAGMAMSGGNYNAWDSSKNALGVSRDWLSDLGALGETALTVVPMAKGLSLAKAGKAVQAGTATAKQAAKYAASQVPKSLGQKMMGAGLLGAGYGATGSLRDMGSENFNPQQLALSAAIGGGVGAGMAGLGGLWNKYTAPTEKGISLAGSAGADTGKYQDALNTLKEAGIDTTNPDLAHKSFRKWSITNHPDKGGSEELFKKVSGANDLYQKLYETAGKGGATPIYSATPKQSFGQKLSNLKENVANTKAGTKVANLLKTKKGKIGVGLGSGLLLSQLMRGRNSNSGELTDEEMQELYNYIYGGGQ